jgi:hypothetical protein
MSQRQWRIEDLLEPGAQGRAQADARLRGNESAQRALADFDAAWQEIARAAASPEIGTS